MQRKGAFRTKYLSSLGDVVELLTDRLPYAFITHQSLRRIASLSANVPASAAGVFGFERVLGGSTKQVDFAFNLTSYGREWLYTQQLWPRIAKAVEGATFLTTTPTDSIWLEFDTSSKKGDLLPSIFADVDVSRDELGSVGWLASRVERLRPGLSSHLDAIQLGLMFGRRLTSTRIVLRPLSLSSVIDALRHVCSRVRREEIRAALQAYQSRIDFFAVQFDVDDYVIHERFGIEMHFRGPPTSAPSDRPQRWSTLFDQLVEDGFCEADERAVLLQWAARTRFEAPLVDRLIDAALPGPTRLLFGTLHTGLNHVKLTFVPGTRPVAKIYFGAFLDSSDQQIA